MEKMANFSTTLYSSSCKTSLSFYCPKPSSWHHKKFLKPSKFKTKHLRISGSSSSLKDCINNSDANDSKDSSSSNLEDKWADSNSVEVIGIGNRVDSVLDFVLGSSSSSHNLRFWNVITSDASRGQLQQRFSGKDTSPNIVEAPLNQQSRSKAVVLVCTFLSFALVF